MYIVYYYCHLNCIVWDEYSNLIILVFIPDKLQVTDNHLIVTKEDFMNALNESFNQK